MTRGIRNNNPGNLRISEQPWLGKVEMNTDGAFEQFDTAEHGLRALAKVLRSYFRSGLVTIADIINRWAPPNENNTGSYIEAVSQMVGIDSDIPIVLNQNILAKLVSAIVMHENGSMPYSSDLITQAVKDAFR